MRFPLLAHLVCFALIRYVLVRISSLGAIVFVRFNFGWGQAGKSTKLTERSDARACAGFGLATKSICLCCIKMELSVLCKVTNFRFPC